MKTGKLYYTLVSREDGVWAIEFGDYDKALVQGERDLLIHGAGIPKRDTFILTTFDNQDAINEAFEALQETLLV